MNELLEFIIVEGDLLSTFIHLFVICLACDTVIGVAHAIGTVKGSIT